MPKNRKPLKLGKPASIRLMMTVRMLSPGADVEDYRDIVSTLVMTRKLAKQMLGQAAVFWQAFQLGHGLCQIGYSDRSPQFFEEVPGDEPYKDVTIEESRALDILFTEAYPPGIKDAPPGLPEHGHVKCKRCKLFIRDAASPDREEGMVDYFWIAVTETSGLELRTATLKQEDLLALMGRLAGR